MKDHLQALVRAALEPVLAGSGVAAPAAITIDATKDAKFGDFATNVALALAKPLGKPPRAVAELIVKHLPASARVAKAEIAGPGFINFFLAPGAFQAVVPEILAQKENFGRAPKTKGKVMVEFVSANPTGPLHVGHGRNAALGDSISNILDAAGWEVWREYYINDAGRQVDVLAVSVWLRYLELCGETVKLPARGYPGDYVKAAAAKLREKFGDSLRRAAIEVFTGLPDQPVARDVDEGAPDEGAREDVKTGQEACLDALIARAQALLGPRNYPAMLDFALADQLAAIRGTLEAFGVR